jgi:hypothetical protein
LALLQVNASSLKSRNSDLGTLEVPKDADFSTEFGGTFSDGIYPSFLISKRAMGKIDPHQINPGSNQAFYCRPVIGGRPQCSNNFCAS